MNTEGIITNYDSYIHFLSQKMVPRNIIRPEMVFDEIDELAQKVRIAVWNTSKKQSIISPKSLIQRIAHNEAVNIYRRHKSLQPLSLDEEGEISKGRPLIALSEGMQDPADEFELSTNFTDCLTRIVNCLLTLPRCQLRAMICDLKDRIDTTYALLDALKAHGVDIDSIHWPEKEEEKQKVRASRSIARKKLKQLLFAH